jgi:hypothetical protein
VPVLVIGARPVWRVPAYFTLPQLGKVALLGSIDIDAESGELNQPSSEEIAEMQQRANVIASRLTSPAAASS